MDTQTTPDSTVRTTAQAVPFDVLQAQLEDLLNAAAPDFDEAEALEADLKAHEQQIKDAMEAALQLFRQQAAHRYSRLETLKAVCENHKGQAAAIGIGLWQALGSPRTGGKTHGTNGEVVVNEQRVVEGFDTAAALNWVIDPQNGALNFAPRVLDEKRLKRAMIDQNVVVPSDLGTVKTQVEVKIHVPKLLKRLAN